MLGARRYNAWFAQPQRDGSTTALVLTSHELLHEYALDPEPPEEPLPVTVADTTSLFRKDASTSRPGMKLHAVVESTGALTLIESEARGVGALADWRPARFRRFTETGETLVEAPLDWPNVTIDHLGIAQVDENVALLAVTVAGTANLALPGNKDPRDSRVGTLSVSSPEGRRGRAILQLDPEGVPESFFGVPELEPDTEIALARNYASSWLLTGAPDDQESVLLASLEGQSRSWLRVIRGRGLQPGEGPMAQLRGPYPMYEGMVMAGELNALDFGDGALITPLSGVVVMLDAAGNLEWARATSGRILATSIVDDGIVVLTLDPSSPDAHSYTLDSEGHVLAQATISWPAECGASSGFELEDAAVYGTGTSPKVVIECTDTSSVVDQASTQVHVFDLG